MQRLILFSGSVLLFLASFTASAITIEEIIEGIEEASRQQMAGVDNYWIQRDVMGISSFEYFEKLAAIHPATGELVEYMRMVPPMEMYQATADSPMANASPEELREAARLLREQGPMMESVYVEEMSQADMPGGIVPMVMNPPPDQPWLSSNPNDMMSMYATMFEGAADGIEEQERRDEEARQEALSNRMDAIANSLSVVREESLNGRPAAVVQGPIPAAMAQQANGQGFVPSNLEMWVDTESFATLKMRIEGEVEQDGDVRQFALELEEMNYQPVPGCSQLVLPTARVMRMSGVLTPEEEAEMAAQMAEMQQQLDSLPPGQREMIMRQMGPQMEMLENMASGGGMEMSTAVTQMSCNTGLPEPQMLVSMFSGIAGTQAAVVEPVNLPRAASSSETDLVRVIQNRLQVLGYTPGNTDGELDTPTVVAITQFESANQLPVTGEATQQLAAQLQQAIDGNLGTGSTAAAQVAAPDPAAQEACLREKIQAAQQAQQTRRGVGSLLRGVGRAASRLGTDISGILQDVSDANATADDLASAARDLGLTDSDIEDCM